MPRCRRQRGMATVLRMAQRAGNPSVEREGFFSRYLEYLLLAVIAVVGVVAVLIWDARNDESSSSPTATAPALPTCADAKISPQTRNEGRCRTATAVLTVVNGQHRLKLPGVT